MERVNLLTQRNEKALDMKIEIKGDTDPLQEFHYGKHGVLRAGRGGTENGAIVIEVQETGHDKEGNFWATHPRPLALNVFAAIALGELLVRLGEEVLREHGAERRSIHT
jgi:hypothetical protein